MIRIGSWILLALLLVLASFPAAPAAASPLVNIPAQQQAAQPSPPALCPPGVYLAAPDDCIALGPSAYLTRLAGDGMTLPLPPLQARRPDPSLAYLPFSYVLLKDGEGGVYGSVEAALSRSSPSRIIPYGEGLKFASYVDIANVDDDPKPEAYNLRTGGWLPSSDVSGRWGATPMFQGVEFEQTPTQTFGWINAINATIPTYRAPGYANVNSSGRVLNQYQIIQVYAEQEADGMKWFLTGPDEWVEGRFVGRVIPNPTPPEGVPGNRWIEVNLEEQTLMVYDQNRLVFATLIATGIEPFYTRPGVFQVYNRLESTTMSGAFTADRSDFYYLEDVPWTMYYDEARALHGAYWRARLGFPQSHGCVNLSPGDAQWIFNWTQDGDWVYVWDPSGRTPTDPSFYGAGGA